MPIAYFPSLQAAETLEVAFAKPTGGETTLRLLVDSGFTGQSSFVLPESATDLAHAQGLRRKSPEPFKVRKLAWSFRVASTRFRSAPRLSPSWRIHPGWRSQSGYTGWLACNSYGDSTAGARSRPTMGTGDSF